jgi:hypothetical protein
MEGDLAARLLVDGVTREPGYSRVFGSIDRWARKAADRVAKPAVATLADFEARLAQEYGSESVRRSGNTVFVKLPDGRMFAVRKLATEAEMAGGQDPSAIYETAKDEVPGEAALALMEANGDRARAGEILRDRYGWGVPAQTLGDIAIVDPASGEMVPLSALVEFVGGWAGRGTVRHELLHAMERLAGNEVENGVVRDPKTGKTISEESVGLALERGDNHPALNRMRNTALEVLNWLRADPGEPLFKTAERYYMHRLALLKSGARAERIRDAQKAAETFDRRMTDRSEEGTSITELTGPRPAQPGELLDASGRPVGLAAEAEIPTIGAGGVNGRATRISGARGVQLPARYVWLPTAEVQASHDPQSFAKNPNYPLENPRNYGAREEQEKVIQIANEWDPHQHVTDSVSSAVGPPIVMRVIDESGAARWVIVGGNNRQMAMQRAGATRRVATRGLEREQAAQFGLPPPQGPQIGLYRYAGEIDLGKPGERQRAQNLMDALNPSPGRIQSLHDMARVDSETNIGLDQLARWDMGIGKSDAQAAVNKLIAARMIDARLRSQIGESGTDSQMYLREAMTWAATHNEPLVRFISGAERKDVVARGLVEEAVPALIEMRRRGMGELADAAARSLATIASEYQKQGHLWKALDAAARQTEADPKYAVVNDVAEALRDMTMIGERSRVLGEESIQNYGRFWSAIRRAMSAEATSDLFGEQRSAEEVLRDAVRYASGRADEGTIESVRPETLRQLADTKTIKRAAATLGKRVESDNRIRAGMRSEGMQILQGGTTVAKLQLHPDFEAAKRGDTLAAARVVSQSVSERLADNIRKTVKPGDIIVPVIAEEATGRNRLPQALAEAISHWTGAAVSTEIVQVTRAMHRNADAVTRLIRPAQFSGPVEADRWYVLVDDHITMGGTIRGLARLIFEGGGKVRTIVSLSQNAGGLDLRPGAELVKQVRKTLDTSVKEELGYDLDELSRPEVEYLARFVSADRFGNRVTQARREAGTAATPEASSGYGATGAEISRAGQRPRYAVAFATSRWPDAERTRKLYDDGKMQIYRAVREGRVIYETALRWSGDWNTVQYADSPQDAARLIAFHPRSQEWIDLRANSPWYAQARQLALSALGPAEPMADATQRVEPLPLKIPAESLLPIAAESEAPERTMPTAPAAAIAKRPEGAPEGAKLRRTVERLAESERFGEAMAGAAEQPTAWYDPMTIRSAQERIRGMTDAEREAKIATLKATTSGEGAVLDREAVLAWAEKLGRLHEAEDKAPFRAEVIELSRNITTMAQLLRSMAEIRTKPEVVAEVAAQAAESAGGRPNDADRGRLLEAARGDVSARSELAKAEERFILEPAETTAKALDRAKQNAEQASDGLLRQTAAVTPKGWADIILGLMQGNVLTPTSLVANFAGNIINMPLRGVAQTIAATADGALRIARITGRRTVGQPLADAPVQIRAAIRSLMRDWPAIWMTGSKPDKLKAGGEVGRSFHPGMAWKRQFTRADLALNERAKLAVEGLLGVPAEIFFRALSAGDSPFYRGAYEASLREIGRLKVADGLMAEESLAAWMKVPDRQSRELAEERALEAVYQGTRSLLAKGASAAARFGSGPDASEMQRLLATILWRPVLLYTRTPANILSEAHKFLNPAYSAASMVANAARARAEYNAGHMRDGDAAQREAMLAFGRTVVGTMIWAATGAIARAGLTAGPGGESDKEKALAYLTLKPNHVNLTGMKRWRKGGNPAWQPGDIQADYRPFGIIGLALNAQSRRQEIARRFERAAMEAGIAGGHESLWAWSLQLPPALGSAMLDYSMMKGTATLLSAIQEGHPESWLAQMADTLGSVVLPNTLRSLSRAELVYLPESRSYPSDPTEEAKAAALGRDIAWKLRLKLHIADVAWKKMGGKGPFAIDQIPVRTDLFGRPVRMTPEGKNPWIHHLVDTTKAERIPADQYAREVGRLSRELNNNDVIPTIPGHRLTHPVTQRTIILTDQQTAEYKRIHGALTMWGLDNLMRSPQWDQMPPPSKAAAVIALNNSVNNAARFRMLVHLTLSGQKVSY